MHRPGGPVGIIALLAITSAGACGPSTNAQPPAPTPEPQLVTEAALNEQVAALETAADRIGPDDLLKITVFDAPDLSGEFRVSAGGDISLPLLGTIAVAGRTPQELEDQLEALLRRTYMKDPHVSVQVTEQQGNIVYVVGAVQRPDGFPVSSGQGVTVLRALALSGGLTPTAAKGSSMILRPRPGGGHQEIPIDLGRILEGSAPDPPLRARDVLFVPTSGAKSLARGVVDALVRMITLRAIWE